VAKSSNTYDIFNVSGCGENENRRARQCLDHAMETVSKVAVAVCLISFSQAKDTFALPSKESL